MNFKKQNKKIVEYIRKKKIFSDYIDDRINNQLADVLNAYCETFKQLPFSKMIIEKFCEQEKTPIDEIFLERTYLKIEDTPSQTLKKLQEHYGI